MIYFRNTDLDTIRFFFWERGRGFEITNDGHDDLSVRHPRSSHAIKKMKGDAKGGHNFLLVLSVEIEVTSSIQLMRMPARASAHRALCVPGPDVLVPMPSIARSLIWSAVVPTSRQRTTTSCAASIAAYEEDSSRFASTFIPPGVCVGR